MERSELGLGILIGLIIGLALGVLLASYFSKGESLSITRDTEGRITEILKQRLP